MGQSLEATAFAAALQQGQAGVFPTDTLPALATTPEHAALLWRIKQRPQNKPVILMGADGEQLFRRAWSCNPSRAGWS